MEYAGAETITGDLVISAAGLVNLTGLESLKTIGGNLIVYPNDRDEDVAVLVVGKSPEYTIAGWLPISFAKVKRYKNPKQDSWWIDQANLNPITDLRKSNYANRADSAIS